ncbi:hypothetical protein [Caldisphaera sp.]|uniref:hypothetical protein n=1 Tax=Caldisphaera sp. TaxID=2060322 RepID=UPI0025BD0C9E|nr:hypothetical protein [Caldisphaera sp.]
MVEEVLSELDRKIWEIVGSDIEVIFDWTKYYLRIFEISYMIELRTNRRIENLLKRVSIKEIASLWKRLIKKKLKGYTTYSKIKKIGENYYLVVDVYKRGELERTFIIHLTESKPLLFDRYALFSIFVPHQYLVGYFRKRFGIDLKKKKILKEDPIFSKYI